MSWRIFQTGPLDGAAIVNESIRRAADDYAATLLEGNEIIEATDAAEIAPFRQLLPAALARRGLRLEQIAGGWRIERAVFPPPPAECTICRRSFFFDCEHGIGLVIEINWGSR